MVILSDKISKPIADLSKSTKNVHFAYLNDEFFSMKFKFPQELLDITKTSEERNARTYTLILIEVNGLTFLIPLRTGNELLTNNIHLEGCLFQVPTDKRNNAVLDYRKAIIVNPCDYRLEDAKITHKQKKQISDNLENIKLEFYIYFKEFLNAFDENQKLIINNPETRERYLKSALRNFWPFNEINVHVTSPNDVTNSDDLICFPESV